MLPKKKMSRSRSRWRRSHDAKTPVNVASCPKCNQAKLPHTACDNCGYVRPGLSLQVASQD